MKINRIILYRDGACIERRLLTHLQNIIPEVHVLAQPCQHYDLDAKLAEQLLLMIHTKKAEMILSVDYYPILAEAAHTVGIPYVSWIIDAPHYTLYSPTSFYDEVFIFHFDAEEVQRLSDSGRRHIFHQPLATDAEYFSKVIKSSRKNYYSDVSFLGSSYQNEHDYLDKQKGLSEYERGYFEALINAQRNVYGVSLFAGNLSQAQIKRLLEVCDIHRPQTYDLPESLMAENVLEKRVSVLERQETITRVAERFGITLYSYRDDFPIEGVDYRGYADYETQMALVFANSKINLNMTLRRIHSGIPLRALDIMGCGGFLLTNYQPELLEYFMPGESLEIYESIDDLLDKCEYYLKHDAEREQIAAKGFEIVKESFSYEKALERMLSNI
ncbi:MAG: hypothetical protein E7294_09160 [Lachnospiraceae bacterium]|nr:hypothetical protein [Lachnospiraceae bacterium]